VFQEEGEGGQEMGRGIDPLPHPSLGLPFVDTPVYIPRNKLLNGDFISDLKFHAQVRYFIIYNL
jgi:hypothetical protein